MGNPSQGAPTTNHGSIRPFIRDNGADEVTAGLVDDILLIVGHDA